MTTGHVPRSRYDRDPHTGYPLMVLVCHRCRYVTGAGMATNWVYRGKWLCPACAPRRTWWERVKGWVGA